MKTIFLSNTDSYLQLLKKETFPMKATLTILILLTVFPLNTFAQDIPYIFLKNPNRPGAFSDDFSVAFSPDGQILASGNGNATIELWDAATGTHIRTLSGHTDWVRSVAFSPDGKILASGGRDATIRLWNATTGEHIDTLSGHTSWVYSVAFSPDGKILASGSGDNTIGLWDATTGEHIETLSGHTSWVSSVAFSPDGKILASGGSDETVKLWDATTGKLIHTLTEHTDSVYSVAFSPDGKILASGGRDATIRLWNATTGEHTDTLRGHRGLVLSVAFSPNGKILASGSHEGATRLWGVPTGELIHTLGEDLSWYRSIAFSPDGKILASGAIDIILWELPDTHVSITPARVVSPAIGEQFTVNISIVAGENVGGYQVSLVFDSTALRYVESANGDYLPPGAFFVPPVVSRNKVTLGATTLAGVSNGDGTLATVTFEVVNVKHSVINLSDVIITDGTGEHLSYFVYGAKVEEPSLLPSSAIVSLKPSSILSPAAGEQLTFNVEITGGQNVTDFQLTFDYDSSALGSISTSRGNYLVDGVGNGNGTLAAVTFEVLDVKASTVGVSGYLVTTNGLRSTPTFESAEVIVPLLGDVNRDGVVNILDLVQVASKFGQQVSSDAADINEDGIVNIVDLVKVAGALGDGAAAPSVWHLNPRVVPTRVDVQQWLTEAQQLNLTDAASQRGILFLEQLLAALTPKETALLPNYPNPFNPETWIPYQLAAPADVTVTIYSVDGSVVRTLVLGHQSVGIYQGKSRAAYWDGKNEFGESVASGVYFYTFTAGEFNATRKMLIMK